MVQCLFLCLTDGLPIPLWLPCMMGAVGLMFALIATCCTISLASAGYFTACAFLTAEFAASLEWQLWSYTQHTLDLPRDAWSTAALSLVYLAAVYTAVFGGIRRLVSRREDPPSALAFRAEELWPPVVISAACFFMSNLSFVYSNTPFSSSVLESIYNIRTLMDLAGVAMLYAYFVQKPQYRKQFARKSEQFTRSLCQGPENVIGYALSTAGARPVPVTTVYDMESTPWWNNFGDFKYTNTQEFNSDTSSFDPAGASPSFVNYVEGIYVGYKFYETAAAEGLIDYDRTVQYPFGYGLSYTSFTQEMGPISERNGTITFDVTVTNTGSAAGKDVVAAVNQFAFAEGEITYLSRANGFANYARTAFAGRNFEYYAEDGMLSGAIASNAVAGAKEHGVYSYMKHFALNDQEGNRNSMLCTWSNEQAIRNGSDLMLVAYQTAAKWVREGGLFFLFSNLVTVWQYLLIQFLPAAFSQYANVEWMWPGVPMSLFGASFTFNVLGYSVRDGGLAYFIAYLIATFTAQCINFPLQRNITFRSHGAIPPQIAGYFAGWVGVTLVVNSINSIWVGVAGSLGVPDFLYNILTTVLTGGVSMVIFFVINKLIFPEGDAKNRAVRLDGGAQTLSPQNKRSPWQEPEGPVTQIISIKAAMRVVSWPTSALE